MSGEWRLVEDYMHGEEITWFLDDKPRICFCRLASSGFGTPSDAIKMAKDVVAFMNEKKYVPYPYSAQEAT